MPIIGNEVHIDRMMRTRTILLLTVFSLVWSVNVAAQMESAEDHLGPDFLQPQVSVGFSAAPVRYFQDIDGTFGTNSATLTAVIPVYQGRDATSGDPAAYFMLARGQFSSLNEDISFLPSLHAIYKARIGMTGGIATTNHHLYLLTIGAGFAEDRNTIRNPRIRATGSLLGKYNLDNSFAFIYGLSYSYTFDRGLFLPLLGTHCLLGNGLTLHLILPFSVHIDFEEAPELHFGFAVRANGDQVHVKENSYFGTQSLPLFMKIAQIQGGFSVSVKLSGTVWLIGEAGFLRSRNFAIGTVDANFVSSKVENSGYSSIVLRYDIGSFESWED
jgi:hypothetical protein